MKKLLLLLWMAGTLCGTEYFVGKDAQFKTVGEGVRALKPGDTLTVLPGEYFESVEHADLGAPDKTTTIRARRPGTVLLRGDKEAPKFTPVPGTRFTYAADWKENANAVNERDSLKILLPAATLRDLEFRRGRFFHDRKAGKLYISSSDGKAPENHYYTVSVIRGNGLYLQNPVNVVIDGLYVTGFYSHDRVTDRMSSGLYGIRINHPRNSTVRNCVAFFNANGIHSGHGDGGVLEHCTVYANGSHNPSSGGGLVIWGPVKNSVIRDCRSFFSAKPQGAVGIRIYGGKAENCRIERCVSFGGEQSIGLKAQNVNSRCIENFSAAGLDSALCSNNTAGGPNGYAGDKGILRIDQIRRADWDKLFADPENYDFRPQEDATGVEAGLPDRGNVYFISPFGNDSASGRSLKKAWKTFRNLKPDTTVYLLPGHYQGAELSVPRVTLRTRGSGSRAIFTGNVRVSADSVTLRDVNFIGGKVTVSGNGAKIEGCGFAVPLELRGKEATVVHNAFLHAPELEKSAVRHSNLTPDTLPKPEYSDAAAGDFTLKNSSVFAGRGFDALPVGPYRLVREAKPAGITGPFVRSVTANTADIEWWTDRDDVTSELRWGGDPSCGKKAGQGFTGGSYHSATLSGLEPGKRYYFKVASRSPLREHHGNTELAQADDFKPRELVQSPVAEFTTETKKQPGTEFFVSPSGSDSGKGSEKAPFASISRALETARAGDTITVAPGVYREEARFRSGGDSAAPLTLRSAVPGAAVIDGFRTVTTGISLENKSFVTIDGFTFRELGDSGGAAVRIDGGGDITVKRCFSDGRSNGYTPGLIRADGVRRLTVENCVVTRGFHGSQFWRCPELTIRNCVWHLNQITNFYIHNLPTESALVKNNLIMENIPSKHTEALFSIWHIEALKMENNAFGLRMEPERRALVGFTRKNGDLVSRKANLEMLRQAGAAENGTLFADPKLPVLPAGLLKFQTAPPLSQESITRTLNYNAEALKLQERSPEVELGFRDGVYAPWKIKDFISGNPELLNKKIGLDPEQFR